MTLYDRLSLNQPNTTKPYHPTSSDVGADAVALCLITEAALAAAFTFGQDTFVRGAR